MKNTSLKIVALTDRGMEREHNEDFHTFCPDLKINKWSFFETVFVNKQDELGSLIVVADGMGGMNAGEVASELAVSSIKSHFANNIKDIDKAIPEKIKKFLSEAILFAHQQIIDKQKTDESTKGMGTTIVIAWIAKNYLNVSWVGDSRCYLLRMDENLHYISKDHSMVQEMVDNGKITYEQAFYHPQNNIITQSLGDKKRTPVPGFVSIPIQQNDIILLCSDGLNGMLTDKQLQEILVKNTDIEIATKVLIEESNKAGGHDNITAILCQIVSSPIKKAPAILAMKKKKYSGKTIGIIVLCCLFAFILTYTITDRYCNKVKTETKDTVNSKKSENSKEYQSIKKMENENGPIIEKAKDIKSPQEHIKLKKEENPIKAIKEEVKKTVEEKKVEDNSKKLTPIKE
jgi:serine/threonine protein phosphatase PrpC